MLNLEKGSTLVLEKADGSSISNIRIGLAWDVADTGSTAVDLDLFVMKKWDSSDAGVIYFWNKKDNPIDWIRLSEDNRTGDADGDDEFVKMDAKKTSDWVYIIGANIYDATSRNQTLALVKSGKATIYNQDTNEVIATFALTENGWDNTGIIIAEVTDSGNEYSLKTVWAFVKWDINEIRASVG